MEGERLEILFLDTWLPDRAHGSGSAVAIAGLAHGLGALGHRVTILRPRLRLPWLDLTRLVANLGFRSRVHDQEADLVVGFDLDGCFVGAIPAPYVVALKGVMADELQYEAGWTRIRFRALSGLERINARRAARVIVTSEHSRKVALEAYGLDPEHLSVVPEGIDVERWSGPAPGARHAGDPPTILSIARQYRRKNTATLIRALPIVRQSVPGARLRVVGDGPESGRLRRLVRALDLESAVSLLGSVRSAAEIRTEMARAQVFCLPSRQEGFGIVFLEAMAAGLPIVAARCAAAPETAPHDEVALLVDPDDVEGLAAALVRLLRDEELWTRLVSAGSARWRRYGWPDVARRFLQAAPLP